MANDACVPGFFGRHRELLGFVLAAPVPLGLLAIVVGLLAAFFGGGPGSPWQGRGPVAVAEAAPARAETVSIGWVGDVTPGSRYGALPGDGSALFASVRPLLRSVDLMAGNLEGTIGPGGAPRCGGGVENCFSFQADRAVAGGLKRSGFDLLNLANNHSMDYGVEGRWSTVRALHAAGVSFTGLPGHVTVLEKRDIRVAFVGFATYDWSPSLNDPAAVRGLVAQAADLADVVVVLFHGGAEGSDRGHVPVGGESYLGESRGDLRAFAHGAVDAGADLVLGSGPHVLRGMELYRDRLIAYSLGNFAGVDNFSTAGALALSGVLTVRVERDGRLRSGWLHGVRLSGRGIPAVDGAGETVRTVDALGAEDFGEAGVRLRPNGRFATR